MSVSLADAPPRATDDEHVGEPPERWMAVIEARFVQTGARIVGDYLADAARLIDPDGLLKALPGPAELSRRQIADIKLLIRQHYVSGLSPAFRASFWEIPEATIRRWRALGVVGPTGATSLAEPIGDAATAARLAAILDTGTSYAEMLRLAAQRPPTGAGELSREMALDRAYFALDALAWRHGETIARAALGNRQAATDAAIADYHAGQLVSRGTPRGFRQLASQLHDLMKGETIARDWQRVAVTELRWTYNHGALVEYQGQGVRRVYFRVHPDACKDCKRLLLLPDGTPRIFTLDAIMANAAINGGTNVGLPKGEWRATLVIHAFCRCSIVSLPDNNDENHPSRFRR